MSGGQKRFVAAPEVLAVDSAFMTIGWSYGEPYRTSVSREAFDKCTLQASFRPFSQRHSTSSDFEQLHYWRGDPDRHELLYERPWFGGSALRLRVHGIGTSNIVFEASRNYMRQIRFRFNNLHSVGYLSTDLIAASLLNLGWCPIHCGSVALDGQVILIVAAPNSGKTLTALRLATEPRSAFVAEDLAFSNGGLLSGCSETSTFRYYEEFMTWRDKLMASMVAHVPPAELLRSRSPRKLLDVLPNASIADRPLPITHIFVLERRRGRSEPLGPEAAVKSLIKFNRYEFKYLTSPAISAANYFWGAFSLEELLRREREVIKSMVSRAQVRVIRSEDPREFSTAILRALG
jgi:hypothetical protein